MPAAKVNIAGLVAQMPETDREKQARKEAEQRAQQPAEQETKPNEKPDRRGAASKFTGPDLEFGKTLFEQALAGGREALDDLANLVRDPGNPEFKDYKAEYFLHGLAIYVSAPGREAQRTEVVRALVAQISNGEVSQQVRAFFIRELRVIGTKDAATALGKLLNDEQLCADAAAALVSLGQAEPLRNALDGATGKCRLSIVQSLGALRDEQSLTLLRAALTDADAEIRLAAAWALARIGDVDSIGPLLQLADVEPRWERIKGTQSCLLLAENLAAKGRRKEARKIYLHFQATRTDPHEWYLHQLADKALLALGTG